MITSYIPKIEDLWFKETMLADPDTMSYNHAWGGTISFPEEKWQTWYEHWIKNPENKRYYRYLKDDSGCFIGEIAYHYDEELDIYLANVIVHAPYRNKGYGSQGLDLLCAAAKEHGIRFLFDNIAIDNPAVSLFLKHDFVEDYRDNDIVMLKKEL